MQGVMKVEQRILQLAEEKIIGTDSFILSARVLPKGRVVILVDGDQGVSIERCSEISRYVGFMIEEENLIESAYTLEVSSPGVDHPLLQQRQYPKHVGRSLEITLADNNTKEGKLVSVQAESITIEEVVKEKGKKAETVITELPFNHIKEAKVIVSFK